ncbi:hypothetical protein [Hymenobacter pini]|uniref:hypothetical protein n=1 Tax=Hymenobacter pini TaxID=2880879 RepID=UPI001CF23CF4|nr:hypothetical protein [Hymenobacter pini]MCA8829695.1 hypothetical protein [Hymenobacter pini]
MENWIDSYYANNRKLVQYALYMLVCVLVLGVNSIEKRTLLDFDYDILDWLFGSGLMLYAINPLVVFILGLCVNYVCHLAENRLILGFIGIPFYFIVLGVLLLMNYLLVDNTHHMKVFKIHKVYMITVAKTKSLPAVLINNRGCKKNLLVYDYSLDEVAKKKFTVLKVKRGFLGWDVIESVALK